MSGNVFLVCLQLNSIVNRPFKKYAIAKIFIITTSVGDIMLTIRPEETQWAPLLA